MHLSSELRINLEALTMNFSRFFQKPSYLFIYFKSMTYGIKIENPLIHHSY